jgi:hypothetical protein
VPVADHARALPALAKELVLVAALPQSVDHPGTLWPGMAAILLEHEGQLPADELGPRHSTIPRRSSEQPIIGWIEGYRRGFLSDQCHFGQDTEDAGGNSIPSTLMSSSTSGQWTPSPSPMIR